MFAEWLERNERRHMGRHHHGGGGRGRMAREFFADWRGTRTRRGDIKFLILEVLFDGSRHGYDVIRALEERSEGRYRPSPGSVYPTLQLLEEGGYVTGEMVDGKRVFTISDSGRELLAQKPPGAATEDEHEVDLRGSAMKLAAAVAQAAKTGDDAAHAQVRTILDRARREIYAILAEAE